MKQQTQQRRQAVVSAHVHTATDVLHALDAGPEGLSTQEAEQRLSRWGRNVLPTARATGLWRIVGRQFASPLIYILLVAAGISAALGDWSDAGFIVVVLVLNAVIGAVQEFHAERSAHALQALTVARAIVRRDGRDQEVDAALLVPGDVVVLEAGAQVPADVRLLPEGGVEVDESLLTGESLPVVKQAAHLLPEAAPLGDRVNLAFAGTLVTRGRGAGVVVGTGLATQLGRIADALTSGEAGRAPLLLRMERFARKVALAAVVAVAVLGAVSVARGQSAGEVFLLSVALAVAIIPEGLPVALTVALSLGARRMARRRVLARRLVAVESLGSCTFIASDKTGTLTMNELTVREVWVAGAPACRVSEDGAAPDAELRVGAALRPPLVRLVEAAATCNDAVLARSPQGWVQHGDAVDVALLVLAARLGVERPQLEARRRRVHDLPFDAERRYAARVYEEQRDLYVAVKGAGERLLPMCTAMATTAGDVPIDRPQLEQQAASMAAHGYRVLAIAAGELVDPPSGAEAAAAASELPPAALVFLGYVAMVDPLRPGARESVAACRAAGLQVAMVTGDHPVTALSIARELGLADSPAQVVTGDQLTLAARSGAAAVDTLVARGSVFARVEPTQKLEIVASLQRQGQLVAVTGDGANDAPALRAAHIGVAMGLRGTDVARASAALILTNDDFSSIVAGVEEGRVAYANVRKVIYLLISSGAAEVLLFVLTTIAGLPVPLRPVQLLWLNLVTNGIQDVALACEPAEGGELARPPRPPREPIFDRTMVERTLVSALVISGVSFVAFRWMLQQGWSLGRAQSGVLLLMVLFENVQAGNSRSETVSAFRLNPLRNPFLLVGTICAQLLHVVAMHVPVMQRVLHLEASSSGQWVISLAAAMLLLVVSEGHKWVLRRRARAAG